jgi:hypothetical protein
MKKHIGATLRAMAFADVVELEPGLRAYAALPAELPSCTPIVACCSICVRVCMRDVFTVDLAVVTWHVALRKLLCRFWTQSTVSPAALGARPGILPTTQLLAHTCLSDSQPRHCDCFALRPLSRDAQTGAFPPTRCGALTRRSAAARSCSPSWAATQTRLQ